MNNLKNGKLLRTTSVQCDPEPKPVIVVPPPPPPPPPQPESESESELTESESTYTTSEESSTTLTSEDKSKATSDSYMSDGAWLISKSEGQIIPIDETGKSLFLFYNQVVTFAVCEVFKLLNV